MNDEIKELIRKMEEYSSSQEYEKAQDTLSKIINKIYEPETGIIKSGEWFEEFLSGKHREETIKDTFNYITSHAVRLSPEVYGFSTILNLTISVNERINKTSRRDDYTIRKIIAEEMVCNEISVIPASGKKAQKYKKPNRAFLDIALKVNPSICKGEISRREKVKLWKAIESKDENEIKRLTKEIKELKYL